MIYLTGLDNKAFVLNADHIEKLQSVPETVITLTNGKKYLVKEDIDDIINRVLKYKRSIYTLHNEI
ncbi:flagellar FlbD family protein [Clostridium cochlearium]|jgi:flagellar protein FlbD|uniref:Flagellar FlbD family protein n=1 Tax=Clostridium cochlearium TaxID=1494 RepID=A0A7Y3XYV0_CLOCO|nr:flagellar FlbD family protein [Clostridium cochlearium]NSJ92391.1 flagellar FlbD family protein [Coprococcus sp. MSK.21.13]MBE6065272.1 endoflagellar protein [Clostridium cochlearium]MBU5269065.1 flagellar FlbD family protein [Clostridium cochlearium]MCG4570649.1 flagellar FlbD family protein [Clostridium cochlearium]MCG4579425.1 flagellar FlbD family protein [Clostridium cochlearium]